MYSSKSFIIFATVSVLIAIVASAPIQSNDNNQASETEATNLQMALPRIGAPLPGGVIPPPAIPAPIIPSAPKLPGNLGINGNRWGASLLPKLEGVLGELINRIPLDKIGQKAGQANATSKLSQGGSIQAPIKN